MTFPCPPAGSTAVIFISQRTTNDAAGYAAAARDMEVLAKAQPGFVGFCAVRDASGLGLAVSYWRDEAAAVAWRDQADHALIRDQGRVHWYQEYALSVASVTRSYSWNKDDES
jgi:heme-degrading monooxygenase HmoA